MTDAACLVEALHDAPSIADVVACLRKLLNHRHALALHRGPAAERAWLLCGGRPDTALAELRMHPSPGWPPGFYDLGPALPLSLVVLSELPLADETLPLRLMGAGATFQGALRSLRERYGQVPRGRKLYTTVVQLLLAARRRGVALTEAIMLDLTEAEEYLRTQHALGLEEGRLEGQQRATHALLPALVRVTELTLYRAITDAERDALVRRLDTDGPADVGHALATLDAPALAAWLRDA